MLTAFYEYLFNLFLETLQVQRVDKVEDIADFVCDLRIVKFR